MSGTASWLRGKLGWYPIIASRRKQSTIALSSGKAELVAALSGGCEGMSLRQRWNWLLKFGCNAEETNETTQQILCCDSSAAKGMIKRKGSARKTRHIELKAFFLQQWSVQTRPSGNGRHACGLFHRDTVDTKIRYISRDLDWTLDLALNRFELGRKDRAEEECRNSSFIFGKLCFSPVLCGTHHTFYNEFRVDVFVLAGSFVLSNVGDASHEQLRTNSCSSRT